MTKAQRLLALVLAAVFSRAAAGFSAVAPPRPATGTGSGDREPDHGRRKSVRDDDPPSSYFKPWPKPLVVSRGDYNDEIWLEEYIGGPLYEKQAEMPRLPVPSLEDTVARLVPTALPLAESEAEASAFMEACEGFRVHAAELQDRLEQRRDDNPDSSWLQSWWQKYAYLTNRDPLTVFVSYYLLLGDDPKVDNDGLKRAAAVLVALGDARRQICSGEMPHESAANNQPLCSTAFKYVFHSCRVPLDRQDQYHLYDPSLYRHCIVSSKGQFFAVDFVDQNDEPLPLSVLESRLRRCRELASSQEDYPQLGWLTTTHRDNWARARQELLDVGGRTFKRALRRLESGAFVLCLDEDVSNASCTWPNNKCDLPLNYGFLRLNRSPKR